MCNRGPRAPAHGFHGGTDTGHGALEVYEVYEDCRSGEKCIELSSRAIASNRERGKVERDSSARSRQPRRFRRERRRAEDEREREKGEILGIILKHIRHRGIYLTFIGNREILRPKRVGSRETEVEETLARIPEPN